MAVMLRKPKSRTSRDTARDGQRRLLLDTAILLLAERGPAAMSLRRLAKAVDASTMTAYTLFGGKDGLVRALRDEGWSRLANAFAEAPRGRDPLRNVRALGLAYRAFALAEPAWFALMAGRAVPGVTPPSAREVRTLAAYRAFRDEVRACIDGGVFPAGDPEDIADGLWGAAHGMITLELAGYFSSRAVAEARFTRCITAAARGYALRKTL